MADQSRRATSNKLLAVLSDRDFSLLSPHFEAVSLTVKRSIEEPDVPIEHVFFPGSGIISVVTGNKSDQAIEVGLIGREGMSGTAIIMGNHRSPNRAYVQVAGEGLRIGAGALRKGASQSPSLNGLLLRYAQSFMIQVSQTAMANARGKLEERLGRWILMADDRVDGPDIPLTHEFLSIMLGVRRAGVTETVQALEGRGLIAAERGHIRLIDRDGVVEIAGSYYGVPEKEYRRLMEEDSSPLH